MHKRGSPRTRLSVARWAARPGPRLISYVVQLRMRLIATTIQQQPPIRHSTRVPDGSTRCKRWVSANGAAVRFRHSGALISTSAGGHQHGIDLRIWPSWSSWRRREGHKQINVFVLQGWKGRLLLCHGLRAGFLAQPPGPAPHASPPVPLCKCSPQKNRCSKTQAQASCTRSWLAAHKLLQGAFRRGFRRLCCDKALTTSDFL